MEVTKVIKLNVKKEGSNIICNDLTTLQLIVGTKGVGGNYHYYGITKKGGKFIVPVKEVQKRMDYLNERIAKFNEYISIMKQVL